MPVEPIDSVLVGPRCLVTLVSKDWNIATAKETPCGVIDWMKQCGAKVHVASDYYHRQNASGQRNDTIPTTNSEGMPVPEVAALIALISGSQALRLQCIQRWCAERPVKAALYSLKAGFIQLSESPDPYSKNWQHNLMGHTHRNQKFFREWVKEWHVTMIEAGRFDEINAWQRAANRSLEARRAIASPSGEHSDGASTLAIHRRIVHAIELAANACAGVPYQAAVRKCLDEDGGSPLTDDLRQRLRTLGFNWIPGEPDWKKTWAPIMHARGW